LKTVYNGPNLNRSQVNQFEQIHPLVDRLFFSPKTSMTKIVTNQVLKISGVVVLSPIVLALIKTFVYK